MVKLFAGGRINISSRISIRTASRVHNANSFLRVQGTFISGSVGRWWEKSADIQSPCAEGGGVGDEGFEAGVVGFHTSAETVPVAFVLRGPADFCDGTGARPGFPFLVGGIPDVFTPEVALDADDVFVHGFRDSVGRVQCVDVTERNVGAIVFIGVVGDALAVVKIDVGVGGHDNVVA